jgi:aminoglycoside 6-adenylyltransferase
VDDRVGAFLGEIAAWAAARRDIRAVLLVGSQARADTPADELSDVDLAFFVDDPQLYLGDRAWLSSFGEPLLTFVEPTAVGGFQERRVLFRDGLEVDFSILPVRAIDSISPDAEAVLARGFSVVYAELGLGDFNPVGSEAPPHPTQAALDQASNDFWYHLLWAAKKLRRGEVLLAKQACDCYLTGLVVELARWLTRDRDTWHGYRFFERWAGDSIVEALRPTFARYEAADVARALRAKGELFGELGQGVAQRFDLADPVDRAEILRRLDALLAPKAP